MRKKNGNQQKYNIDLFQFGMLKNTHKLNI